jgi:hypothetical protein
LHVLDDFDGELLLDLQGVSFCMEGCFRSWGNLRTSSLFWAFSASKFLGTGAPAMLSRGSMVNVSLLEKICLVVVYGLEGKVVVGQKLERGAMMIDGGAATKRNQGRA